MIHFDSSTFTLNGSDHNAEDDGGWLSSDELDSSIFTLNGSDHTLNEDEGTSDEGESGSVQETHSGSDLEEGEIRSESDSSASEDATDEEHEDEEEYESSAESGSEEDAESHNGDTDTEPTDDRDLRSEKKMFQDVVAGRKKLPKELRKDMSQAEQMEFAEAMLKSYAGYDGDSDYEPSTDGSSSSQTSALTGISLESDDLDLA